MKRRTWSTCDVQLLLDALSEEDVEEEHLAEVDKMLPYLVAAGHYKNVSCLPHYLGAMRSLPTLAPNIYREFKDGKVTVHQTEGQLNGVWTDMA